MTNHTDGLDAAGVAKLIESARSKAAVFADTHATFAEIERELREASALMGPKSFINGTVVFRSALVDAPAGETTHRHLKSGHLVRVIGTGKMQSADWHVNERGVSIDTERSVDMREVVIYEHDGNLWVRPVEEFNDGRFEQLAALASVPGKEIK